VRQPCNLQKLYNRLIQDLQTPDSIRPNPNTPRGRLRPLSINNWPAVPQAMHGLRACAPWSRAPWRRAMLDALRTCGCHYGCQLAVGLAKSHGAVSEKEVCSAHHLPDRNTWLSSGKRVKSKET
jgi:hypothetical protein